MRFYTLILISLIALFACRKEEKFTTDPSVKLEFSTDSVLFDTVFTSLGSVTQKVKIFNRAKNAIRISEVRLAGIGSSPFQININGVPSGNLTNVEIRGNDSINVFVKVTINPNTAEQPFLVADSVKFVTNGNEQFLQLRAYGQNARFIKDGVINNNTTWDDKLPYIIYNALKINEGKTLTILKGTKVFFHKGAKMEISGTLKVEGTHTDSVTFASDRLERIYLEEPGQWDGIHFLKTSTDNVVNHAAIKNAIIGLQVDSASNNSNPKLLLANSVVRNMEIAGLSGYGTTITAFNNIISNCEKYLVYCTKGGDYNFKQNTFANLKSRSTHSIYINDYASAALTFPLKATFINNIIWGANQSEFFLDLKSTQASSYTIKTNIIKSRDATLETMGNFLNQDPLFLNARGYDFRLLNGSAAENKGESLVTDTYFLLWLSKDYSEQARLFPSELGAYEIL